MYSTTLVAPGFYATPNWQGEDYRLIYKNTCGNLHTILYYLIISTTFNMYIIYSYTAYISLTKEISTLPLHYYCKYVYKLHTYNYSCLSANQLLQVMYLSGHLYDIFVIGTIFGFPCNNQVIILLL